MITFKVSISTNRQEEEQNFFYIEIRFTNRSERLYHPRPFKEAEIVFRYLWPNPYYQIDKNLIVCTPSAETSTGSNTPVDPTTPELQPLHEVQLPPSPIPEIPELPGIAEFNRRTKALHQRVEVFNNRIRELPLTVNAKLDNILERVRAGENLDELAFSEGTLTYRHLRRIDQLTNPHLYSEASLLEDADYQPPRVEEPEPLGEEEEVEEEEEHPLHIPDPTGIPSRILPSEHNSEDLSEDTLRNSLDEHLGTTIKEAFSYLESD